MSGLKIYNKGKRRAVIEIDGVVGMWDFTKEPPDKNTKTRLKNELKKIADLEADEILVKINSPGGSVDHGLAIYDLLAEHPAHIITEIYGMTASIATVIAMAGDERRMSENALAMVHLPSVLTWGNKNQLQASLELLDQVEDRLAKIYAKKGSKTSAEFKELMNRNGGNGAWMDADEMTELGLVTEIYEPARMAAFYDPADFGLPAFPENKMPAQTTPSTDLKTRLIAAIKDFFEPQPDPEADQTEPKNNNMDNNTDNNNLEQRLQDLEAKLNRLTDELLPKEEPDTTAPDAPENTDAPDPKPSMADRFAALEQELNDAKAKIQALQNAPAASDTAGDTDDQPDQVADYMNLDIHAKARAVNVPKK